MLKETISKLKEVKGNGIAASFEDSKVSLEFDKKYLVVITGSSSEEIDGKQRGLINVAAVPLTGGPVLLANVGQRAFSSAGVSTASAKEHAMENKTIFCMEIEEGKAVKDKEGNTLYRRKLYHTSVFEEEIPEAEILDEDE